MKNYSLTIGWLYPELMSTYGDRGNITVLQKRCEWRDIQVEIIPINQVTNNQQLKTIDLLFGGGAQDHEQELVMKDLQKKGKVIKELIEKNIPALFVCGAPQLMGNYYEPSIGKRIEGLGIFDMYSKHPGKEKPRLIGNVVAKTTADDKIIVGFENHGGRTYLGSNAKPFATIIKGFGNNGEDRTEGVVYKNAIGCYLHGPLLPKNPAIADHLIKTSLEVKYQEKVQLKKLDDSLEIQAQQAIIKRLS
jgi:lipid II isoglutaminyl synthase (glutamine-hydrolysing)